MEPVEDVIQAAQEKLLRSRQENRVVHLHQPTPVSRISPGISQIDQTSGLSLPVPDNCPIHYIAKTDGVCPSCEDQARSAREKAERAKREKLEKILGNIGLGARYRDATFSDYLPTCDQAKQILAKCQAYAETFQDRLSGGDNLIMLGNYGTGKNTLSAAICNRIALDGYQSLHTTAIRIIRRIRETWGRKDSEQTEQQVINSFTLPDLLVVDEIGVQVGSDDEKRLLFEALNGRYEDKKPTVLISNLRLEGLKAFMGERLLDRFYEGSGAVLQFTWQSYRKGNHR